MTKPKYRRLTYDDRRVIENIAMNKICKSCLGCLTIILMFFLLFFLFLSHKINNPNSLNAISFWEKYEIKNSFKNIYGFPLKGKPVFDYTEDYIFDGYDQIVVFDVFPETQKKLNEYLRKNNANEISEYSISFYNLINAAENYSVEKKGDSIDLDYLRIALKKQKNVWGIQLFQENHNKLYGREFIFAGFVYLPSLSKLVYIHYVDISSFSTQKLHF